MSIKRFNQLTNSWELVASGDASEVQLLHESYLSENVQGALTEISEAIKLLKKNINYLYHNGSKGGGGSSLPSVPNDKNIIVGDDGRKSLGIVEKIEGDQLSCEELNAIVEVINNNSEMFFSKSDIEVPTESGGTLIVSLKTAEDILNFIKTYGTSMPSTNVKPILLFDRSVFVFTLRSDIKIPFTVADADGGSFMVSFLMIDSSGSTALHKFYYDDSYTERVKLHSGDNVIKIPGTIINSNNAGTYKLQDFKVYDAYYKTSTPLEVKVIVGSISISEFNPNACSPLNQIISIPIRYSSVLLNITIKTKVIEELLDGTDSNTSEDEYEITLPEGFSATQVNTFNLLLLPTRNIKYTASVHIVDTETGGLIITTPIQTRLFVALDESTIYVLPTFNKLIYNRYDIMSVSFKILHSANVVPLYDVFITSDGNVSTLLLDLTNSIVNNVSIPADTEFDFLSITFNAVYKGGTTTLTSIPSTYRVNVLTPAYGSIYASTGTVLWLDAKGRTNKEIPDIRNVWPNKIKNNVSNYNMRINGLFTSINGWEDQVNGLEYTGNCLKLSAGAYGVIDNLQPFKNLSLDDGLTFEVCMRSTAAQSVDTTLLSLGKITNDGGIIKKNGIFITPTEIQVYLGDKILILPNSTDSITYLKNGNVNSNEEEYLHITIVYKKNGELNEGKDLCIIYVNGVISNAIVLPEYSTLDHLGKLILNGYEDFDGEIKGRGTAKYRFVRLYSIPLNGETVLSNYIASMYNTAERDIVFEANRRWDANDIPFISKMYMEGDVSSMTNKLGVNMLWTFGKGRESELYDNNTTVVESFIPDAIAEDGIGKFENINAVTKWQGSSSADYMIKNYTIDILPLPGFLDPIKYSMTAEFPESDTFLMKTNYIDSSGANNIACTKIANQIWARNWSDETLKTIQTYSDPEMTLVIYSNPMFYIPDDTGKNINLRYPIFTKFHALDGFPYVLYRDFIDKNKGGIMVKDKFGGIYMCNILINPDLYNFEKYTNTSTGTPSSGPWARSMYYKHDNNGSSTFASQLTAYLCMFDPRSIYDYSKNGKTKTLIQYKVIDGVRRSLEECLGFELLMGYSQECPDYMGLGLRNGLDHTQWTYDALSASGSFGESLIPFTNNDSWKYKWTWNDRYMYTIGTGKEPIRKLNTQDNYTYNGTLVGNISKFLVDEGSRQYLLWDQYAALAYHQNVEYINSSLWVATASEADFSNPAVFNRYLRLDSCIDYVIMAMLFQMTDSLGRNLTMVSWDKQDPVRESGVLKGFKSADKLIFYPHYYDCDTSFGTDVYGTISNQYMPWPHAIAGYDGLETRSQITYRVVCDKQILQPSDTSLIVSIYLGSNTSSEETSVLNPIVKYAYYSGNQLIGDISNSLSIPSEATSVKVLLYIMIGSVLTLISHLHLPINVTERVSFTITDQKYANNSYDKPSFSWIVNNENKVMLDQIQKITTKSYLDGVIDPVISYQVEVDGVYVNITDTPTKIDNYYPFKVYKQGQDLVFDCKRLGEFSLFCKGDDIKVKATTTSGEIIETIVAMNLTVSFEFSYNCVSNLLWKRLCKSYPKAIKARYSELRKGYVDSSNTTQLPILTLSNIIDKYCTLIVNRIGERYYNQDAFLKYFGSEYDTESDIQTKRAFVGNARGNKFLYVKDFLNKRMMYIDSILGYVDETSGTKGSIAIRHGYDSLMTLRLATVAPSFITIQWALGVTQAIYLPGNNKVVEISYDYTGSVSSGLTWMKLMNCSNVSMIEGLSGKKVEKIEVNGLSALKKLDISLNSFIQTNPITFINCENIEELYMSKITGNNVPIPIDISSFGLLKIIDVSDSVVSIISFAKNKSLNSINLTNNIYTANLDISGMDYLSSLQLTPENIVSLNMSYSKMDFSTIVIPSNSTWRSLTTLNASNSNTTSMKRIGSGSNFLPLLRYIDVTNCPLLTNIDLSYVPAEILLLDKLNIITLNISNTLLDIDFTTGEWTSLLSISAVNNTAQSFIGKIDKNQTNYLPALTELNVIGCTSMKNINISGLSLLSNFNYSSELITGLDISYTTIELKELSDTVLYSNLLRLYIIGNSKISSIIANDSSFNNLNELHISDCVRLATVKNIFKDNQANVNLNDDFLARCLSLKYVDNIFLNSSISVIPTQMFFGSNNIITTIGLFKDCKNLTNIPSGVMENMPNLQDITDIFYGATLLRYTDITYEDEIGDIHIIGKNLINVFKSDGFLSNAPNLKKATNSFNGCEIVNLPINIFASSTLLLNIDYCFSNIENPNGYYEGGSNPLIIPSTLWTQALWLSSAKGLFKNTYINNVHDNILSDCPRLTDASELFYNSMINKIPTLIFSVQAPFLNNLSYSFAASRLQDIHNNFLNNIPNLTNISNIFYGSYIVALSSGFLVTNKLTSFKFSDLAIPLLHTVNFDILSGNSVLISVANLFSNTKVQVAPDNLLSNNPTVSNIDGYLSDSIVQSIGTNFLSTNAVPSTESMFAGRVSLPLSIGSGFMKNSLELVYADYMFEGCIVLTIVPENMMNNCPKLISAINMFNNASKLTTVKTGFLQNAPALSLISNMFIGTMITDIPTSCLVNPLISTFRFSNIVTRNVAIATTFLQDSPLTNVDNLFTGTLIDTVPSEFFNTHEISNPQLMFSGSAVNVIGNNTFARFRVENATNLFYGSSIVEIGDDFMAASGVKVMDNILSNTNLINRVGNNFMGGKASLTSAISSFENSSIASIGTGFITNAPLLVNVDNIFNGCENITALPVGFLDSCPLVSNLIGLLTGNGITAVPVGFLNGNTGLSAFRFSTFVDKDFAIPADFLQGCLGTVSIDNLFTDSPITVIPDNFFHNLVSSNPSNLFLNSAIKTIENNCFDSVQMADASSMFSGTTHGAVETIGDNFMVNSRVVSMEATFKENSTIKTIGNNFMGIGAELTTLKDCFSGCSNLEFIGLGFADNAPNLISIVRVLFSCGKLLTMPVGMLNSSHLVDDAMYFIGGAGITFIPDGFMPNSEGLDITSLDSMFWGNNLKHIGNDFMLNIKGVHSINELFKDNNKLQTIGNNFMSGGLISSANGLFKNCTSIVSVGDNFLVGNPLTSANHFFDGATALTAIRSNFFNEFPELVDITYFFNNTTITQLPVRFLGRCYKVNSLEGVLLNNLITAIPDEFLMNNTGITSLRYLKDSVPTSVFADTLVSEIGDALMYGSTGLTNIDNAFEGNTTICTIGQLFLAKSKVTTANSAFKNVTNLETIGSGVLMGCPLTSIVSMFEGCSSLIKIGDYFEWYDPSKHDSYLYTKEKDECKCNTAGQQAEVALFTSTPYLESEFYSLTCGGISNLSNIANVFRGTGLIRTPKGFLKEAWSLQNASSISSVLNGSLIKFFNPDLFCKNNITNISTLFDDTGIIAIPTGFMESAYTYTSEVIISWSDKSTINSVAYIPKTFLRNCCLWSGVDNANYIFMNSNIRMLQDDWLDWRNAQYKNLSTSVYQGVSFVGSRLTSIPRGFMRHFKSTGFRGVVFGNNSNLDTIIPELAFESIETFTSIAGYGDYNIEAIKGVVPKTFLSYKDMSSGSTIARLFSGQNIVAVEKGWMEDMNNLAKVDTLSLRALFLGCKYLKYLPDTMFKNIFLNSSTRQVDLVSLVSGCSSLKNANFITNFISPSIKPVYLTAMFLDCTLITNSNHELDSFLLWATSNNSALLSINNIFAGSGIMSIPDGSFQNCPNLYSLYQAFTGCSGIGFMPNDMFAGCTAITDMNNIFCGSSLKAIPIGFLKDGTTNTVNISSMFARCCDMMGVIPEDFLMNVKGTYSYSLFSQCSKLTGTIPSNFLKASSGSISYMSNMFNGCKGLTGFTNNIWNITDMTKVVSVESMFEGSGMTQIPDALSNTNFASLTDASDMFLSCSNLVLIPDNFMQNAPQLINISSIFIRCSKVTQTPVNFISNSPALTNAYACFTGNSNMKGVLDANFLSKSTSLATVESAFNSCSKITGIAQGSIFERLLNGDSALLNYLFNNCINLTGNLPELWNLYPSNTKHYSCFHGCINASNYSSVPTDWK